MLHRHIRLIVSRLEPEFSHRVTQVLVSTSKMKDISYIKTNNEYWGVIKEYYVRDYPGTVRKGLYMSTAYWEGKEGINPLTPPDIEVSCFKVEKLRGNNLSLTIGLRIPRSGRTVLRTKTIHLTEAEVRVRT